MRGWSEVLERGVERAISVSQVPITRYVTRLRRARPGATPAEIIGMLEKRYVAAVTGIGAAVGATTATAAVGPAMAVLLGGAETVVFVHATALFALAVAEVHGIEVHDVERRRTVVWAVVIGDHGAMLMEKIVGEAGEHWIKLLPQEIPSSAVTALNKTVGRWFVTKYGHQQAALAIRKVAPLGMGTAVGAGGNRALSHLVITASRRMFGPPPASFPPTVW